MSRIAFIFCCEGAHALHLIAFLLSVLLQTIQGCCLRKISRAHKAKSREVRSLTCEVLGAAAKN